MADKSSHLKDLDYSVVQQCMHCGLCLPTCPTYDATKLERNSPRGRISLMRAIADGRLEPTKTFADEMYFCLGSQLVKNWRCSPTVPRRDFAFDASFDSGILTGGEWF